MLQDVFVPRVGQVMEACNRETILVVTDLQIMNDEFNLRSWSGYNCPITAHGCGDVRGVSR